MADTEATDSLPWYLKLAIAGAVLVVLFVLVVDLLVLAN